MGLFSMISNVATIGSGVTKSVFTLGKSSFKAIKSVCSSTVGKIMAGIGVATIGYANKDKISNFFSTIFNKVSDVKEQGVSGVIENTAGKAAVSLKNAVEGIDDTSEYIVRAVSNEVNSDSDDVIDKSIQADAAAESEADAEMSLG